MEYWNPCTPSLRYSRIPMIWKITEGDDAENKKAANNSDSMMQPSNQRVRDAHEGFGPTPLGRKGGDALAGSCCASDREHRGAAS